MLYEEPIIYIIEISADDIITTSSEVEEEWKDENTDDDGWT